MNYHENKKKHKIIDYTTSEVMDSEDGPDCYCLCFRIKCCSSFLWLCQCIYAVFCLPCWCVADGCRCTCRNDDSICAYSCCDN